MSKNINCKIVDADFPNRTYCELENGEMVSTKGGLVGQVVEVRLTRKKKNHKRGKLIDVLEASPMESDARCPHSQVCGGCTYQTLDFEQEAEYKKNLLEKLYQEAELLDGELKFTRSPVERGYRNKMEYSFGDEEKDGPLALGLHRKARFYELVNTDHCNIVPEDFNMIRMAVRDYFDELGTPFYHLMRRTGILRYLVLRYAHATGEILVNLVTTHEGVDTDAFVELLMNLKLEGRIVSIYHTKSDALSDAVVPEEVTLLYGKETIEEKLCGLNFHVGPFSFFQPNPYAAEVIYERARELVGDEKGVVFDLYSGTGTIAQILAEKAEKVIGIEIIPEAVEKARVAAVENGLDNVEFICGDVLHEIEKVQESPDLLVLDPPRDGIHPKAIDKILAFQPKRILYISCNPRTHVRDLKIMEEHGYGVEHLEAVDQFSRTSHVETVVLMSRKDNKR